jgi:hypothetical protein
MNSEELKVFSSIWFEIGKCLCKLLKDTDRFAVWSKIEPKENSDFARACFMEAWRIEESWKGLI